MIQGGTVVVLNGGPVAQRGRQEQPRKAELVQKFGPLFSPSLSLFSHQIPTPQEKGRLLLFMKAVINKINL
jgi:hypothetical protein